MLLEHALVGAFLSYLLGFDVRSDDAEAVWRRLTPQEVRALEELYHDEIR